MIVHSFNKEVLDALLFARPYALCLRPGPQRAPEQARERGRNASSQLWLWDRQRLCLEARHWCFVSAPLKGMGEGEKRPPRGGPFGRVLRAEQASAMMLGR